MDVVNFAVRPTAESSELLLQWDLISEAQGPRGCDGMNV